MSTYTNEVSIKSYDDTHGTHIEVTPVLEIDSVRIRTLDKESQEWYGKIDFTINIEAAKALIQAMQKVIDLNTWD